MASQFEIGGRTAAEIVASVEDGIRTGRLGAGDSLPPIRVLADELGISPATAAAGYRLLRERGLVETGRRLGTRVRPRPPVLSRVALWPPVPDGVLDLATGGPDPRLLPPLERRLRRVAASVDPPHGYQRGGRLPELLDAARARLAPDGLPARFALTVTGGALDGIERALTARLRPGDRVAVEDPGWANLLDLVAALGMTAVPVSLDDDGPDPDRLGVALAAGARAVVVTTRAQNPTGASVGAARARALRAVLRRHPDVLVVEDDHAAELAESGPYPLAGATDAWAFVRSCSKPYGPDLRVAILAGDETTVGRVEGRFTLGPGWVSTILQRLVLELWQDEDVSRVVALARDEYRRRRAALLDALSERGVAASGRSGINVWIPVADETATLARLREAGYALAAGSPFRLASPPGVRVTVSALDRAALRPLADAVAAAVLGGRVPAAVRAR